MNNRVLILGGYGNFGKRISRVLARKGVNVLIAGRDASKAAALASDIGAGATALGLEVPRDLESVLKSHRPDVIVNTVGPFQQQGYEVPRIAIANRVHYVDLADGRDYVCGISELASKAKSAGVAVVSGASTVPALSDAVLAELSGEFSSIKTMRFGISPGQGAERGLATTEGVLSYVGKPISPFRGPRRRMYGWQNLYRQRYPVLGHRWMANCEVPDLDLLPERHGIGSIQFSAGMELGALHLGLWAAGWGVRAGLPIPLRRLARPLLNASNWFNRLGSPDGGMHIILSGTSANNAEERIERRWFIIALDGDGPHIPTVPAIVIAARIAAGSPPPSGAYPCLGLITLTEYLAELEGRNITTVLERG